MQGPSTRTRTPRTVLLRMAADQDRATRIRELKESRPDLTWQQIADYTGVSLRAATKWGQHGEISYLHAKSLAALFEVDVVYVMRGDAQARPDLMGALGTKPQLDRIEQKLDDLLAFALERALGEAPPPNAQEDAGSGQDADGS